jgi:hypothetical protein
VSNKNQKKYKKADSVLDSFVSKKKILFFRNLKRIGAVALLVLADRGRDNEQNPFFALLFFFPSKKRKKLQRLIFAVLISKFLPPFFFFKKKEGLEKKEPKQL